MSLNAAGTLFQSHRKLAREQAGPQIRHYYLALPYHP